MARDTEQSLRLHIDAATYTNQNKVLAELVSFASLDQSDRAAITARAAGWVRQIRAAADPGLMESFLAEYGLSTDEGIALMCLAEALLRVPDADTIDALIEDKIAPSDWGTHLGKSTSSLVNASTWALMLTGRVLDTRRPGPVSHLRSAIKRLGEPVIRTAVGRAMKEMGRQFVLGENITSAMKRAAGMEKRAIPIPTTCWARPPAPRPMPNVITWPIPARFPPLPPRATRATSARTPASRSNSAHCTPAMRSRRKRR